MDETGPGYEQNPDEKAEKLKKEKGLHYCDQYNNLVRFNPDFCEGCPYNGLPKKVADARGGQPVKI